MAVFSCLVLIGPQRLASYQNQRLLRRPFVKWSTDDARRNNDSGRQGLARPLERCVIPPRSLLSGGTDAAVLIDGEHPMSNLTRLNPFSELRDPFNEDFFKGFAMRPMQRLMEGEPQMRLDLTEDEHNFIVKAEIPGVKKEDIKVSIQGNQVSLSADVKKEKEEKEGTKLIRTERYYGSVARSFTLDESVDASSATAKYENGVLQLILPKKPNGQSHLLKIA
jgi:HSP20 family protein